MPGEGIFKKLASATVGSALGGIRDILDTVITTKEEKAQADLAFYQLQTKINEAEAVHRSIFVAGWRPFIGWVCGIALLYNFIVRDIVNYIIAVNYADITHLPALDFTQLSPILLGMLGLGALRTYEKVKGKAK